MFASWSCMTYCLWDAILIASAGWGRGTLPVQSLTLAYEPVVLINAAATRCVNESAKF